MGLEPESSEHQQTSDPECIHILLNPVRTGCCMLGAPSTAALAVMCLILERCQALGALAIF